MVEPWEDKQNKHQHRFLCFMWSSAEAAALPRPRFKLKHVENTNLLLRNPTTKNIQAFPAKNTRQTHQREQTNQRYFKNDTKRNLKINPTWNQKCSKKRPGIPSKRMSPECVRDEPNMSHE